MIHVRPSNSALLVSEGPMKAVAQGDHVRIESGIAAADIGVGKMLEHIGKGNVPAGAKREPRSHAPIKNEIELRGKSFQHVPVEIDKASTHSEEGLNAFGRQKIQLDARRAGACAIAGAPMSKERNILRRLHGYAAIRPGKVATGQEKRFTQRCQWYGLKRVSDGNIFSWYKKAPIRQPNNVELAIDNCALQ